MVSLFGYNFFNSMKCNSFKEIHHLTTIMLWSLINLPLGLLFFFNVKLLNRVTIKPQYTILSKHQKHKNCNTLE